MNFWTFLDRNAAGFFILALALVGFATWEDLPQVLREIRDDINDGIAEGGSR